MRKLSLPALVLISIYSLKGFAADFNCSVYCLSSEEANIKGYFEKALSPEQISYLQNSRTIKTNETNLKSFEDLFSECKNIVSSTYNKKRQTALLATISPVTGRLIGATLSNSCLSNFAQ